MTDPVMKPFQEDFGHNAGPVVRTCRSTGSPPRRFARSVYGQDSLALLEPQPGTSAISLLLDVSGNLNEAQGLLAKARTNLTGRGARETDPQDSRNLRLCLRRPAAPGPAGCPRGQGCTAWLRPRQARRSISSPRISSAPATISRWSRVFLTVWPLPASLAAFPRLAVIKWSSSVAPPTPPSACPASAGTSIPWALSRRSGPPRRRKSGPGQDDRGNHA